MNRPALIAFVLLCCVDLAGARQGIGTKLSADKTSLAGGNTLTLTVGISSPAGPNGLDVPIISSDPGSIPSQVCHFYHLETSHVVTVIPNPVVSSKAVTLTAGSGATAGRVVVQMVPPGLAGLRTSATGVVSGTRFFLFTLLTGWATPGGLTVSLSSSNPSLISVPPTAIIPAGLAYHIELPTPGWVTKPTVVTVSASYKGVISSVTLTVYP